MIGMGVCGVLYGLSTEIWVAIVLVMISGFFNSPSSVARSVLLQRNTPREMRGRVFSAFYVMRDVIFLFGMAGAGLADIVDIRLLIVFASSLLFVSAAFTFVAPGPRRLDVARRSGAAARRGGGAGAGGQPGPGRHAGRLRPPRRPARARSPGCPRSSARRSSRARHGPRGARAGTRIVEHGDAASSAYFILDGLDDGRHPGRGRLPRPVDDGRRRLLRRDRGPDRQRADRGRGRRRRHDPARGPGRCAARDDGRAGDQRARPVDADQRLQRTEAADLPRLAGIDQEDLRDLRTPRPTSRRCRELRCPSPSVSAS